MITKRRFLAAAPALVLAFNVRAAWASPVMTVHKDPSCGCCGAWVEHARATGFAVNVVDEPAMDAVKAKLGVPRALASCHTAEIDGYILEGHVPAAEIQRLLVERPTARGLAVPGMPVGAPGMEVPSAEPDSYQVMLFSAAIAPRVYARYRGARRV